MGKPVRVVPYDGAWPVCFEAEAARLREVLDCARAVHHMGSTSVPGLSAKPVVDILVEVSTLDDLDAAVPRMTELGYESRGEYGIPDRRYFVRRPAADLHVHVHCYPSGHAQVERHLLFRDFLRADTAAAAEYGEVKQTLAIRHSDDREAYQAGKAGFIGEMQVRAVQWRAGRESGPRPRSTAS